MTIADLENVTELTMELERVSQSIGAMVFLKMKGDNFSEAAIRKKS